MQLKLFTTIDADNVLNKTLTDEVIINIVLKKEIDLLTPEIILLDDGADFSFYNYAELPYFNRKYFIRDYSKINSRMIRLDLELDALMTYQNEILNSRFLYNRNLRKGDLQRIDLIQNVDSVTSKHEFDLELETENNFILTTIGI